MQIFDLFDVNRNGHIEFAEFIKSLSVFHPKTPEAVKIKCKKYKSWYRSNVDLSNLCGMYM